MPPSGAHYSNRDALGEYFSAQFASRRLQSRIMEHVVTRPHEVIRSASGRLEVHQVPVWQDNLAWLLVDSRAGAAYVVDSPEASPVLAACAELGVDFRGILNTHTHHDHIGVNQEIANNGGLEGLRVVGPARAADQVPLLTEGVDEGDEVQIGENIGRVWLTEGHMNGHVSYVFEDLLFCGDTLFGAGCGYLFDGPAEKMHQSLQRLASLPSETRVFCAHEYTQDNLRFAWSVNPGNESLSNRIRATWSLRGEGRSSVPSTLAAECATNPFIRVDDAEIQARLQIAMPEMPLDTPSAVFAAARALKDRKDYRDISDAELPL